MRKEGDGEGKVRRTVVGRRHSERERWAASERVRVRVRASERVSDCAQVCWSVAASEHGRVGVSLFGFEHAARSK